MLGIGQKAEKNTLIHKICCSQTPAVFLCGQMNDGNVMSQGYVFCASMRDAVAITCGSAFAMLVSYI
jgi:hypothetical protein